MWRCGARTRFIATHGFVVALLFLVGHIVALGCTGHAGLAEVPWRWLRKNRFLPPSFKSAALGWRDGGSLIHHWEACERAPHGDRDPLLCTGAVCGKRPEEQNDVTGDVLGFVSGGWPV